LKTKDKTGRQPGNKKADCGSAFLFGPTFDIEKQLAGGKCSLIAGVDEVGRGALAGPLCLGLVIYHRDLISSLSGPIPGIDDSKKLTHLKTVAALDLIAGRAIFSSTILVPPRVIDRLNINGATEFALNRLLESISLKPDIVMLDGKFSFTSSFPIRCITQGDAKSISIASASIVAKVRRDMIMEQCDPLFPGYNFRQNKGYGTREHIRAIGDIGICPLHRKSYEPVKSILLNGGIAQ
jgi:ribonuclease HII